MSLVKLKTNTTHNLQSNQEFIIVGWRADENLKSPSDNKKVVLVNERYDEGIEIGSIHLKNNNLNKWVTLRKYEYNETSSKYSNIDENYLSWTESTSSFLLRTYPVSEDVEFIIYVKDKSEPKNKIIFEKIVFNPTVEKCIRTYVYQPGMPNVVPYDDYEGIPISKIMQWRRTDDFGKTCVDILTTSEMDENATTFCENNPDSLDCKCINRENSDEYQDKKKKYNSSISDYCWYDPCASGMFLSNEFTKIHYCGENIKKCTFKYIGEHYSKKNNLLESPNLIPCDVAYYNLPDPDTDPKSIETAIPTPVEHVNNLPTTINNIPFPKILDDVNDSPPSSLIKTSSPITKRLDNPVVSFVKLNHNKLIFFLLCITLIIALSIR